MADSLNLNTTFAENNSAIYESPSEVVQLPHYTMGFTVESFIIFVVTICIIFFNILILCIYRRNEVMFSYVNKYFFLSLTVSDLCFGVLITPFSLWASIFDQWVFGENMCHLEAYLAAIFWIVSIYSLMWMSIDYYVSIRKGDRYETVMSPIKAKCWMAFVWLASTFYCCPPLFGVSRARYYTEAFMCIINWRLQRAYLLTSGLLIIVPPLIAITITNCYIFSKDYKENTGYWEKVSEFNSRPDAYVRHFVVSTVYLLTWMPWCCVQLHELIHGGEMELVLPSSMHFLTMWIAIGNSAGKFIIYVLLDGDFRHGLKVLYQSVKCSCSFTR